MKLNNFENNSRRAPIISRYGIAAASQPLAVAAGLKILAQGGNAADAAVAVAAGLNVTEPGSTGLGGDAFCLYYEAATRQIYALNGSGRAPEALTLKRIHRDGFSNGLPRFHPYTATVPGACAAWCDTVERFGKLNLAQVLAPAIELAEEGYPVAPQTSLGWQNAAARGQLATAVNGRELTIDGRGPKPGEIFRNPGLARAMRLIAAGGKDAYYRGPIAQSIVDILHEAGGCMELADLAEHTSTWDEPISTTYHGLRFWECPPNGQGIAALMALNLLEGFDIAGQDMNSAQRLHLLIESMRLAFADVRQYVADPRVVNVPIQELLSKEYAARRREWIDPFRANPAISHGVPLASSDTVYLSVVDAQGNACSFINSNYMGFGTGIVPRGWGFSLQNRGHNFSLVAGHPNQVEPRKRPYHTIIPAMITREDDGSLFASYGVMGGFMQPQGHMQVAVALTDDDLDPQSALDRPRFCIEPDETGSLVSLEEGIPVKVMAQLVEMGHTVRPVSDHGRTLFGRGQVIYRDNLSGVLWGGSDPRSDGCAMTAM
ncbi:MAG TPA: gamma-glutamyltransferase family protein [Anaerolinea sp.]|nr:gamma-glutamyltransferase family protein [Anaerolinea sp.]